MSISSCISKYSLLAVHARSAEPSTRAVAGTVHHNVGESAQSRVTLPWQELDFFSRRADFTELETYGERRSRRDAVRSGEYAHA